VRLPAVASPPAGHDQRASEGHRAAAPKPGVAPGKAAAPAPKSSPTVLPWRADGHRPEIDPNIQTDVWADTYAAA